MRQHQRQERRTHSKARSGERHEQRSIHFLSRSLNLSEEQQQQFDEIWNKHIEKRKDIAKEMETNRREMGKIMSMPEVDTSRYMELANEQAELILSMDKAMVDMNLELRQVLNSEQLPQFLKKIEQLSQRRLGLPNGEPRMRKR